MAVRNSISSGHNILSTIHADKAASIPSRLYSLLESNLDLEQFLRSIHRYVQIGVHIKGYYSTKYQRFHREVTEVTEFYVTEDTNEAKHNVLYKKTPDGHVTIHNPTKYLIGYLESQGVIIPQDILVKEEFHDVVNEEESKELSNNNTHNNNLSTTSVDKRNDNNVVQNPNVVNNANIQSPNVQKTASVVNSVGQPVINNQGVSTGTVGNVQTVNLMPNVSNQKFWANNSQ